MSVERVVEQARSVLPSAVTPATPDAATKGRAPRRLDIPPVPADKTTPSDVVELSAQERSSSEVATDMTYEVSESQELIVKVVNAKDRSEVIRQYPSEELVNFRNAYNDFLKLVGLG